MTPDRPALETRRAFRVRGARVGRRRENEMNTNENATVQCAEGCGVGIPIEETNTDTPGPVAHVDCDNPEHGVSGSAEGYKPSGMVLAL